MKIVRAFFLFPFLLSAVSVQADPLTYNDFYKESRISREFDCIAAHKKGDQSVDWQEVCVTKEGDPYKEMKQEKRTEIIGYTLDQYEKVTEGSSVRDVPVYSDQQYVQSNNDLPPVIKLSASKYRKQDFSAQGDLSYNPLDGPPENDERGYYMGMGTEISWISYQEELFDLEEKGLMYGVNVHFTGLLMSDDNHFSNSLSYRLEGKASYGVVDYQSAPSGTLNNIDDWMYEIRLMLRKDVTLRNQVRMTPYTGLGYRMLIDDGSGLQTSTGASFYKRESRYLYIPIGAEFKTKIFKDWFAGFIAEYDLFVRGKQFSYLSSIPGYPDLKNTQKYGWGSRGSLQLMKVGEKYDFIIEPFFRYWHIKDSKSSFAQGSSVSVIGYEPENTSTEYGLKLGVEY